MFTIQNCWGTGIDQDRLNESLFGTVDLIACKKNYVVKENDKLPDGNTFKRKERKKNKKGKYVIAENSTESSVEDSFKSLKKKRKRKNDDEEPKEIVFDKPNDSSYKEGKIQKSNSEIDEPCNKKRKKISEPDILIIEESKNQKLHENDKEMKQLSKKKKKKKKKMEAMEPDTMVIEETSDQKAHSKDTTLETRKKKKRKKNIESDTKFIQELGNQQVHINTNDSEGNSDENYKVTDENCMDDNRVVTEFNQQSEVNGISHDTLSSENTVKENNILMSNENDIEIPKSKLKGKKKKRKKNSEQSKEILKDTCNELQSQSINEISPSCNNNMCPDNPSKSVLEKAKNKKKRNKKKATVEPVNTNKNISKSVDEQKNAACENVQSNKITLKYNKFQKKIMEKLKGAQFRWINEKLYTCESSDAVNMFSADPKLFDVYHDGFTSQVQQWPQNPVAVMTDYINARDNDLVIADFGCGDAKLARNVLNKVHSFDLVAVNEHVTACDMKKVPISRNTIDIAVFCLSLMGTNVIDFLIEAHRVIKLGGVLKIAEVKSRFEDTDKFIEDVSSIGFTFIEKDESNKMFVLLEFQKTEKIPSKKVGEITLRPCIYKRR